MTKNISNFAETLSAIILIVTGLYFTFKLKAIQFKPLKLHRNTFGNTNTANKKNIFSYFAASLAGAVGTGNIVGVCAAISIGGPGAVFWMWIAAFLGMATKYAEAYTAAENKKFANGYNCSPMEYIRRGTRSKFFPAAFAFFGILSAFTMGNLLQSNASSTALNEAFPVIPKIVFGIISAILIFAVTIGGLQRITSLFNGMIPFITLVFILIGIVSISINIQALPKAFYSIFKYAFKPFAVGGGIAGSGIAICIKTGIVKGLMSNEAGIGSAGLAYANSDAASPTEQGSWAALDVFADTVIISTVTALIILTSPLNNIAVPSVNDAVLNSIGKPGSVILSVCVFVFATSSVITWSYYGESCLSYITQGKGIQIYRVIFSVFTVFGAICNTMSIWNISEIINTAMLCINIIGLFGAQKLLKRF